MIVVADAHIPYLDALEPQVELRRLAPEAITHDAVMDADALLVRTRTRCNADLLEGTRVRFVGTATIGYDHIDTKYCDEKGIFWTSAPGCNAAGVRDYVASSIVSAQQKGVLSKPLTDCVIGIVGLGHVGTLVQQWAQEMGMRILVSDPPKGITTLIIGSLNQCDILTFHTPLTHSGEYPTWHLCNAEWLKACRPDTLIINAARGGIVEEEALLKHTNPFVIDCWEGEPHIHQATLDRALIATCHIAGYTRIGKYNATQQIIEQLTRYWDMPSIVIPNRPAPAPLIFDMEPIDRQLRLSPETFENQRESYTLR